MGREKLRHTLKAAGSPFPLPEDYLVFFSWQVSWLASVLAAFPPEGSGTGPAV